MGQMECYERDFEEHLLSGTADYYRRNAAQWIMQDSCPAYMIKVCCCGDASSASCHCPAVLLLVITGPA
jgi:hypothetical protein